MCLVAINIYGGYNEEDGLIINKNVSNSTVFNGSWFTYIKVDLKRRRIFDG